MADPGRDFSAVLVSLMKGVTFAEADPPLWQALLGLQARVRDYVVVLGLDLILDEARDYGSLSSITAPTLVIHGTADPLFPLAHGEALANEIPGAKLLALEGAGHGVDRRDWQVILPAIVQHTSGAR